MVAVTSTVANQFADNRSPVLDGRLNFGNAK
jgi:hypothetical protein